MNFGFWDLLNGPCFQALDLYGNTFSHIKQIITWGSIQQAVFCVVNSFVTREKYWKPWKVYQNFSQVSLSFELLPSSKISPQSIFVHFAGFGNKSSCCLNLVFFPGFGRLQYPWSIIRKMPQYRIESPVKLLHSLIFVYCFDMLLILHQRKINALHLWCVHTARYWDRHRDW